jgi:hypothetical protein
MNEGVLLCHHFHHGRACGVDRRICQERASRFAVDLMSFRYSKTSRRQRCDMILGPTNFTVKEQKTSRPQLVANTKNKLYNIKSTMMVESQPSNNNNNQDDDDKSNDSSEDDSSDDVLNLEGELVKNSDASSSSSSDEEDEDEEDEEEEDERVKSSRTDRKRPSPVSSSHQINTKKKKKPSNKKKEPDVMTVDFTFHDMDEAFFPALKNLLHASSTVYQAHASALTDHMIDNIAVGTLVSTQDDTEHNVFGFASVLNVTTYQDSPAIQHLKEYCLKQCPKHRLEELQVVLSGTTKRPAGFLLLSRMVNLPLEITLVLYQQLVKDIEWAVQHAEGGDDERKALDFGVLIRLAPCQMEQPQHTVVYRYFEDEIWAGRADAVYTVDAPKAYSKEEKQLLNVIVMTKQGFQDAIKDFEKMVGGV